MRVVLYTILEQLQQLALGSDRHVIKHVELTDSEYKELKRQAGKNWPLERKDEGSMVTFMGLKLIRIEEPEDGPLSEEANNS